MHVDLERNIQGLREKNSRVLKSFMASLGMKFAYSVRNPVNIAVCTQISFVFKKTLRRPLFHLKKRFERFSGSISLFVCLISLVVRLIVA